eukprot:scaffold121661_cov24-Phaeocystis_antarctica.AAC.1
MANRFPCCIPCQDSLFLTRELTGKTLFRLKCHSTSNNGRPQAPARGRLLQATSARGEHSRLAAQSATATTGTSLRSCPACSATKKGGARKEWP